MRRTMARKRDLSRNLPVPTTNLPPRVAAGARPHGLAPGELVKLHHSLAESLVTERGIVAQFVAPESGAGTEDVVYDLAYISAAWLGKRVLFVNGTGMQMDVREQFAPRRREPLLGNGFDIGDVEVLHHPRGRAGTVSDDHAQHARRARPGAGTAAHPGVPHQTAANLRSCGDCLPCGHRRADGRAAVAVRRWQHTGAGVGSNARPGCIGAAGIR